MDCAKDLEYIKKKAVFVLETMEYKAFKDNQTITPATLQLLDDISEYAGIDAEIVFAIQDPMLAGRNKSKIGIRKIREERPRVLSEIGHARPDFVMCMGPIASACVFDKGNLVEGDLLRKAHHPLGDDGPPVFVTVSLAATRWKSGLTRWLKMDVQAAAMGYSETVWGDYTVLLPGTAEWDKMPEELRWLLR